MERTAVRLDGFIGQRAPEDAEVGLGDGEPQPHPALFPAAAEIGPKNRSPIRS